MKLSRSSKAQSSATMPDWKPEIRRRLARLQLAPTRENAILRDERVHVIVRSDVAKSLATLQDREALPDILALLRDERVKRGRLTAKKCVVETGTG
jgi:HEAT repeat protein